MSLFYVRNLIKYYGNGDSRITAVNNVSFDIDEKDIISIVGPSGSGKTTLLSILGGITGFDGGDVVYNGISYSVLKRKDVTGLRLKEFGFVFQNYMLIPSLCVSDNIILPRVVKKEKTDQNEYNEVVEELGLKDRLSHFPDQLSGGEKQRVSIARAILSNANVIFADEPTGNLDSKNSDKVFELLFQLVKKYGKTLIYVTHDECKAKNASRRFYVKDGALDEMS